MHFKNIETNPLFVSALLILFAPLLSMSQLQNAPDPFGGEGNKIEADEEEVKPFEPAAPLSAQISQHILKLAQDEREKRLKFMQVVIEDVVRLCDLDAEQRQQLEMAAKGASERSMKEWHEQAERYFRTRLDGADPDSAKEMLEGMGSVNFGSNRAEEEGESLELWKDTLKVVLTDQQIERYESILEQREQDRIDAFARMALTTIDGHLRLTPNQKEKMGELVHEASTNYLADVQRYWGDYFERGMLMSLANAADDEDLREILTEQQFDRLKEATTNFDHFWDTKRRNRRAAEKAALRRNANKSEDEKEKAQDNEKTAEES